MHRCSYFICKQRTTNVSDDDDDDDDDDGKSTAKSIYNLHSRSVIIINVIINDRQHLGKERPSRQ